MSRPYIFGNSIWITTTAFMSLFEDIEVRNYNSRNDSSDFDRRLCVDVVLDTKERVNHKLTAGGFKKLEQADTRLPRISIQLTGIEPDLERYSGKNVKRMLIKNFTGEAGNNNHSYDVQPFPMRMEFTVSLWSKYFEHYAQMLENIIPWFDPYVSVTVKERFLNLNREIKCELVNVGQSSIFEMEGPQTRLVRGDLQFVVETTAYKAMSENISEIIETIEVHVIDIISPISSDTISISAGPEDVVI